MRLIRIVFLFAALVFVIHKAFELDVQTGFISLFGVLAILFYPSKKGRAK